MSLGVFSSQAIYRLSAPPFLAASCYHLVPGVLTHLTLSTPAILTVTSAAFHPGWQLACVVL